MRLRVKFKKYGPVRFIGHLDVMRFFQKAIRRAGINVAYTEGFSPHQIMTFAAPLGVGITSNGEYMDIEVHSIISCEDVRDRLNAASVPGIEIISAGVLPDHAENAMASVAAASYTVRFREGKELYGDFPTLIPEFLAKDQILYVKKTKKGTRELDLKPGIYEFTYSGGEDGLPCFHILADASSAGNIKPVQIMEAFSAHCGEALQENALLITREEIYTRDKSSRLISLEDMCSQN